jgi:hypothetical protein
MPDGVMDDAEWTLERPEPEQYDFEVRSDDDDDEQQPPDDAPAETGDANAGTEALGITEGPEAMDVPGQAEETSSTPSLADDEFVASWTLGEALPEPSPPLAEALGLGATPELAAHGELGSEAGSFASWSMSEIHEGATGAAGEPPVDATESSEPTLPTDGPDPSAPGGTDRCAEQPAAESADGGTAVEAQAAETGVAAREVEGAVDDEAVAEDDECVSEASFHLAPGPRDRFQIEQPEPPALAPAEPPRPPPNRVTRIPMGPRIEGARYGADALVDERERAHPHLNELPALRAQLRSFGPLGEELHALACRQAASVRRNQKHVLQSERNPISETDWWNCLLQSLGLPAVTQAAR